MRFNYTGRKQSDGRVGCSVCKRPMLGTNEQDPRKWSPETFPSDAFCDCSQPMTAPLKSKEELAAQWLRDNDWDYQKYGDRRPNREAYDTLMNYEISDQLETAYLAGFDAGFQRAVKMLRTGTTRSGLKFGFNWQWADALEHLLVPHQSGGKE